MPYNSYLQISEEKYNVICKRFQKYMANIDDLNVEPIKMFDPLSPKHLEELELIREVSRDLQNKKDEDMRKAEEAEKAAKEAESQEAETENAEENETQEGKENNQE